MSGMQALHCQGPSWITDTLRSGHTQELVGSPGSLIGQQKRLSSINSEIIAELVEGLAQKLQDKSVTKVSPAAALGRPTMGFRGRLGY